MKRSSQQGSRPTALSSSTALFLFCTAAISAATDDESVTVSVPDIDPREYSSSVLQAADTSSLAEQREYLFLYQKVGNTSMIEAVSEVILEDHPRDKEALDILARARLRQGRIPEAKQLAGRLRTVAPGSESEDLYLDVVIAGAEYEAALALLLEMKRKNGSGPFRYQEQLADVHFRMGNKEASLAAYREIIETPGYPELTRRIAQRELDVVAADENFRSAMQHMAMREVSSARALHQKMVQAYPQLEPTLVLGALLDGNDGKLNSGIAVLEALGDAKYKGRVSPYATDLALQYREVGRDEEALALLRAAAVSPTTPVADQKTAMRMLSELHAATRPHASVEFVAEDADDGTAIRLHLDARTATDASGIRLGARVSAHDLDSKSVAIGEQAIGIPSGDRLGAEVYAEKVIPGGPNYKAGIGFEGEKPIWSFEVGDQNHIKREHWRAAYHGNKVPLDSLALEAGDAREHRIEGEFSQELGDRLRGVFGGHLRNVRAGGGSLGYGYGANIELEYLLYSKGRSWATASYFAEYQGFDGASGAAGRLASSLDLVGSGDLSIDSFIQDAYHVHGLQLFGEHAFTERFIGRGLLGVGYRVDTSETELRLGGGFDYYLDFSTRLVLDAKYYSSGSSGVSASSGGAGVRASVGLHHAF